MEPCSVDLCLGLSEEFAVVLSENHALRGNGFEAVAMQMVCEFTGERVEAIEVVVELVPVGRPTRPRSRNRLRTRLTVLW